MEVQAECFSMCGHWGQPGGEAFAVMEESQAGGGRPLECTSLCCLLESGVTDGRTVWFPWWLSGKESACQCRRYGFDLWVGKIP